MGSRGSYWAGTGIHQAEFKRLRATLVTVGGTADTPEGELLRAVTAVYLDLKRNRFRHVADHWEDWRTVLAHRDAIAAAIGRHGTWVVAVVDRAVTERHAAAVQGTPHPSPPARFLLDAVETLIDGCVLTVRSLATAA